jgi:hypothetical protein
MSWIAALGGFLLVPVAGSLASRVAFDATKPKDISTTLLIGAACHAAVGYGSFVLSEKTHAPGLQSFAYGGAWGSGIATGLLVAGAGYAMTPTGKTKLSSANAALKSGDMVLSANPMNRGPLAAPTGILGLLTVAKSHGYLA